MLSLPEQVKSRLAHEFRIAADSVAQSGDLATKLYFLSIFHGEPQRQLNIHWDPDLNLLFMIVRVALQQIQGHPPLPATPGAQDGLPVGFLQALDAVSEELASVFEADEIDVARFYAILARIAELGYVVTGNGYYLYLKGMIKV